MSSEQVAVVTRFLEGFAAGDIAAALDCLAPDCVVDEAHGLPFSGRYVGQDGFMEILGRMSAKLDAEVTSVETLDAGEVVIGKLGISFVSKATGRELPTTVVEIYTVRDGKIAYADVYYKDPGAVTDLAEGGV
jgi:ketosteroid isomerase-like protein